ncbi:peptide/nickel transport system ATP-binding protein [Actinomadura meyerae]|uniref:Peptide/nickel transport system ATP-binding protein n=1 Tax=Actinomadura meyerae TaxID=240840 RepID=A0A239BSY1_9ACTN|nr:ABC transporter ATP-binding protein [Actinomadura meyerae]SNS11117.1 peptide/nickel transport system ATP-binding protein [Actinomadura meyerae]
MTVLRVTALTVGLPGGVRALRDVGFAVEPGEVLAIVGESGAGKTALALAVMGLLPDGAEVTGSVRLRDAELIGRPDAELCRVRGKDLAMVFQEAALTPVRTVGDQVAEAVRAHSEVTRAAARARAAELLDLVGIAAGRAGAYPHELSGGMRQRVMIAMAVANGPGVILADEPTAGLDVIVQAQILDVLRTAKDATGAAIALITHDLRLVEGFADRVIVMREGRIVETGPVERIYREPSAAYTGDLLAAIPRIEGKDVPQPRPERPVVLRVDGLVRHYPVYKGTLVRRRVGSVRAVDGIGFDVREGETLALVGESGCGKTTTLMEILRLARPQQGRVVVFGQDTARLSAARRRALRRDVQVVFQDPSASLNPRMRIADIIAEPLVTHGFPSSRIQSRVGELLELVGLKADLRRRYPHALSGGQKQRVSIARALALEPRLLLLDEPVSALDASVQAGVMALLESLRARLGLAYLLVTHDLAVVHRIADRIAVMYMGRIVELGPTRDVYEEPAHPYTRALLRPDLLQGDLPDPMSPPIGCRFRSRCPRYLTLAEQDARLCEVEDPEPSEDADRSVACHRPLIGAEVEQ